MVEDDYTGDGLSEESREIVRKTQELIELRREERRLKDDLKEVRAKIEPIVAYLNNIEEREKYLGNLSHRNKGMWTEDWKLKKLRRLKYRCPHCHGTWHPKVKRPLKCPKCMRRLKW